MSVALLAEAWLFRTRQLGTIWVYTAIRAFLFLLIAMRVIAGVWCAALGIGGTRHRH